VHAYLIRLDSAEPLPLPGHPYRFAESIQHGEAQVAASVRHADRESLVVVQAAGDRTGGGPERGLQGRAVGLPGRGRPEARQIIDRAKAAVMARQAMTEQQAFRWLQRAAMDHRTSIRVIAGLVVGLQAPVQPLPSPGAGSGNRAEHLDQAATVAHRRSPREP